MTQKADLTERDKRFKKIREAMERESLDGIIVAGHGSQFNRGYIRYGSDTHLWAGDCLILIPLAGEPVQVLVTYSGASRPDKLWIEDFRKAPYPQDEIVNAMNAKGITKGKVGIVGWDKAITFNAHETLKNAFPSVNFINADSLLDRVRCIKSPLELEQIRGLMKLSQGALDRFVEVIGPGVTQREAAAEAGKVIRAGGSFDDYTSIHEGDFTGLPRDIALKCDDMVEFHLETCGESGHWSEINVVCAFRGPTDVEQKLIESEVRAFQEILKMAKPGVTLGEMEDTFLNVIVGDGWNLGDPAWHYSFHGQGMDSIEWPYFTPMLETNREIPVEAGMVFSYHPHRDTVPSAGRPPKIFDDIVITPNGAEQLSSDWDLTWRIMK